MSDYDDDFMGGDDEDYDLEYSGKDIPTPTAHPPTNKNYLSLVMPCYLLCFSFCQ